MAGETGPKDPVDRVSSDKVRQLQRQLWAAAKRAPGRRFHALYGQMCRDDVLHEAWKRVRRNKGAAGVDRVTIGEVEQYGVQRFLQELGEVLRAGEYGTQVVRRAYIPKADGAKRPLGIPTVQDRVVQMAAKLVLEPIYEADFVPRSYGFRPRRGAQQALERLRQLGNQGAEHVLDADIENYFGSVRGVIAELNPVLRGWGQYFRTGNAADHFIDVDDYVVKRLRSLRVKRAGRHLPAGQTQRRDRDYFERLGLHRLRGTICYPGKPPGNGRTA